MVVLLMAHLRVALQSRIGYLLPKQACRGELPMSNDGTPEVLDGHVNHERRASLRRLVAGGAYVVPAVASFSLAGLSSAQANTYGGNG